jgi:hypothetical protein
MEFRQSEHEHAIYYRGSRGSGQLIVGVYVDDLIIMGTTPGEITRFKEEMKQQFKMADLGLLTFYLGLEVQQGPGGIKLCQTDYAMRILEVAGMADCNSTQTSMEAAQAGTGQQSRGGGRDSIPQAHRQPPLPSLHKAGPDIHRGLSQSLHAAVHIRAHGGIEEGAPLHHRNDRLRVLLLVGTGGAKLVGYSDSDYASNVDGSHNTSGVLFFLGSSLVSWHSLKQ